MKSRSIRQVIFLLSLLLFSSVAVSQKKDIRIFNDSTVRIAEISTNTIHSDFGPAVIQDTLYFTTFNDQLIDKSDVTLKNKAFYDLYKAGIDKQGNIISSRVPVKEFITRYNDGPVAWCEKTGELFVTQNFDNQSVPLKPFQKVYSRLRIIIAKKVNGEWTQLTVFPYNNSEYSVGHPAITASGDTLVFSSDQPGGYGETDLYYSVRRNGIWGKPINMGPKINTADKEEFAYFANRQFYTRFLIFSSKGRSGNGGFDIYYTKYPSDFSEIEHFNSPINGAFDDFAMAIPDDAEFGYFTSNRQGTGNDDIYKINFKIDAPPSPVNIKRTRQLYVYDKSNLRPIPGVRIILCNQQVYLTDSTGVTAALPCLDTDCDASASTIGYSDKTKLLLACKSGDSQIKRDTIWMNIVTDKKIVLHNIYYDFDRWNILSESAKELDLLVSLMRENPAMKVELSSYTDDRGTIPYNQKLSERRVKSAIDYLISKGIKSDRITGKGYGKSQLINDCKNFCTPAQHRENRRTELMIPGFFRGEPVKQEKGDYSNGEPDASKGYSSLKAHGSLDEKPEKSPAISPSNAEGYYLIVGSFKGMNSAEMLVQQLKKEGYKAIVLGDEGAFRIGIGYPSFGLAKKALELLKPKFPDAWIQPK